MRGNSFFLRNNVAWLKSAFHLDMKTLSLFIWRHERAARFFSSVTTSSAGGRFCFQNLETVSTLAHSCGKVSANKLQSSGGGAEVGGGSVKVCFTNDAKWHFGVDASGSF